MALGHLRLRLLLLVHSVQHVPDQQGAVADDGLRGPNRIEVGQVGLRNEAERLGFGCETQARRRQGDGCRDGGRFQETPTIHGVPLPICSFALPYWSGLDEARSLPLPGKRRSRLRTVGLARATRGSHSTV